MKIPALRRFAWVRRVPVAVWVVVVVAAVHGLFFWWAEDKHFMPPVAGYSPPPSPPNFGSRMTTAVDPRTGETTTETLFVVSTQLAIPTPQAARKAAGAN